MWNYIDAFPTQDTSSAMGCFLYTPSHVSLCLLTPVQSFQCQRLSQPSLKHIETPHPFWDIWTQARHVFERSCFSRGGKCCYVVCACPLWQHLSWVASRTRGNPWKTWHNNWAASCKGHSTGSVVREKQCMYHLCPLCKCNLFQRCLASYFTSLTAIGSVLNISINYHQLSSTN